MVVTAANLVAFYELVDDYADGEKTTHMLIDMVEAEHDEFSEEVAEAARLVADSECYIAAYGRLHSGLAQNLKDAGLYDIYMEFRAKNGK